MASIPKKMYLQRALQSIMLVCLSEMVCLRCSVCLQWQKLQDDHEDNVPLLVQRINSSPYVCLICRSKQHCLDERPPAEPPPPSKRVVVHHWHSIPSIGQRRHFVVDKSGVTFWKNILQTTTGCASTHTGTVWTAYVGYLRHELFIIYLVCFFFHFRTGMIMRDSWI